MLASSLAKPAGLSQTTGWGSEIVPSALIYAAIIFTYTLALTLSTTAPGCAAALQSGQLSVRLPYSFKQLMPAQGLASPSNFLPKTGRCKFTKTNSLVEPQSILTNASLFSPSLKNPTLLWF